MGVKIISFVLYLAVSYGVIYFLIGAKRFLGGWNANEPLISAAITAATILIVAIGTMLVGPVPMVLMVVALVAFIAYRRSCEALPSGAVTASDRGPSARTLPSLADSIGLLERGLAAGVAFGAACARHPSVAAAGRALAEGAARLAANIRSRARKPDGSAGELSNRSEDHTPVVQEDHTLVVQVLPVPEPPPVLSFAEEHGLDAVRAALVPPKPAEPLLTRDQAKRLLDHLEGRQ
jgi:hypothetical protein